MFIKHNGAIYNLNLFAEVGKGKDDELVLLDGDGGRLTLYFDDKTQRDNAWEKIINLKEIIDIDTPSGELPNDALPWPWDLKQKG